MRYEILDRARRLKGWTLEDLAGQVGKSVGTCQRVLAGKAKHPKTVKRIADVLEVDLETLYAEREGEAA